MDIYRYIYIYLLSKLSQSAETYILMSPHTVNYLNKASVG